MTLQLGFLFDLVIVNCLGGYFFTQVSINIFLSAEYTCPEFVFRSCRLVPTYFNQEDGTFFGVTNVH